MDLSKEGSPIPGEAQDHGTPMQRRQRARKRNLWSGIQVSCTVGSDTCAYEVFGRSSAGGSLLFWVERHEAPGQVWMHISHHAVPTGVDPKTEFVAATEGGMNRVLAEIALQTGWFARSGRSVEHPVGQRNEVWRITPECPLPVAEVSTVDLGGMQMAELLTEWTQRMHDLGLTAVVVTVPDPFDGSRPRRKVAGAQPSNLRSIFGRWQLDSIAIKSGIATGAVADLPRVADKLGESGFASWVALRLPWQSGVGLEILMLSADPSVEQDRAATAGMRTLEMVIHLWRAAGDAVVPITARERDVLRQAIEGRSAEETARLLKLSHHTVGYHIANVVKKFGAEGKLHAAVRAMMVGSLLDPEQQ